VKPFEGVFGRLAPHPPVFRRWPSSIRSGLRTPRANFHVTKDVDWQLKSRWYNCRNQYCKTTLNTPDEFKVWNENAAA
jgi:hypothetical protein